MAVELSEQPVLTYPTKTGQKRYQVKTHQASRRSRFSRGFGRAATPVSKPSGRIVRQTLWRSERVSDRSLSPEGVEPESSNQNYHPYPGGPRVRISLPPVASLQTSVLSESSAHQVNGRAA